MKRNENSSRSYFSRMSCYSGSGSGRSQSLKINTIYFLGLYLAVLQSTLQLFAVNGGFGRELGLIWR